MKKLPLIIRNDWYSKSDDIQKLRRHFHTIILDSFTLTHPRLAKVFETIGANVRHFELDEITISHHSFSKILSSMPKMEKMIISESNVQSDAAADIRESGLKKIDSLVMIKSDWQFLNYLTESETQVRELKVTTRNYAKSDHDIFEEFLAAQDILEDLAIRVAQGDIYKSLAKVDGKFKLKKLAIDFKYWGDDPSVDEDFIKFLKNHQSTLQDLETEKSLSEKVSEFVMKELKLKRLIIDATRLPRTPLFYNAIRQNKHLKTLLIEGELNNFDVVRGLLYLYPTIKRLVINSWREEIVNDVIVFIANNLKNLRCLEIPSLTADTPELAVPSLKTFHVDFVNDVAQYQTFLMNNPSLETIIVKWTPNEVVLFTYEVLNAITLRLQNLRHVKFGESFKPTHRILEMMRRNCQNLQLIEIFDGSPENQRNANLNLGSTKVIYYPRDAAKNMFKIEQTMWEVENNLAINSDLDSDEDMSDDDDMMSFGDLTDHESDFDYVDEDGDVDGIMFFF